MKLVVTGGAGFIGSATVSALRERGDEVAVIDLRSQTPLDLCDEGVIEAVVTSSTDAVVHLAARTSVLGTIADPMGTFRVNVDATSRLAEQCRRVGVPSLVFASTNAVAGAGVAEGALINEATLPAPLTPYGASKAAAEAVLSAYQHTYGLLTTVVRLANVYGPGMLAAEKDSIIARLLRASRGGETLEVYGSGEQVRDYVFVSDVVDTLLAAVDGRVAPPILAYGSGASVSVLELARTMRTVTGVKVPLRHVPAKVGEMPAVRVDISLATSLGLTPQVDLDGGLELTWASPH
jgi:UDP-glucose 4-epimerase